MNNQFLEAINKEEVYDALTENGAVTYASTYSNLLNYFSTGSTYRNRNLLHVFEDVQKMWREDPLLCLKIIFYNRLISRQIKGNDFSSTTMQRGQGAKDEFRAALLWLADYKPHILYKNLHLVPLVGCWKDLWHIEVLESLRRKEIIKVILQGLKDPYHRELLAKYLPRLRSKSNVKNYRHQALNRLVYALLRELNWTPKQYRQFKSSGKAHRFQQQMSTNAWNELNFKEIPGRALTQLVNNRGRDDKTTLERRGQLPRFMQWIETQPTAKFKGYVYELVKKANEGSENLAAQITINKQFKGLLQEAKADGAPREKVWCALDTSGSMTSRVANTTAYDICIGLGIYFSALNEGAFENHVIMFDNVSRVLQLKGTFIEKLRQIQRSKTAWGGTNFQSIIDRIVRMRKERPDIPIEDYPETLLVVSDMQFNPVGGNTQSNYQAAMQRLAEVGLPNMQIIWWWVTGRVKNFPNRKEDKGVVMIGGFDGAVISLLLGEEARKRKEQMTPYEAMLLALDQDILKQLTL